MTVNGRTKRRKRAERNRNTIKLDQRIRSPWKCPNGCGEPGPHYVPPSFGDSGFYICRPLEDR